MPRSFQPREYKPRVKKEKQPLTEQEAYPRLLRYCAYQERSIQEVRRKMQGYMLDEPAQENLIRRLQEENYLSEKRFIESYTGGKARSSGWGARKISIGLAQKGISREDAYKAVSSLDTEAMAAKLRVILEKRDQSTTRHLPPAERRQKLFRLGLSRGFDTDTVSREVARLTGAAPMEDDVE